MRISGLSWLLIPSHVHITWRDFGSCPVKPTMMSAVVLSVTTIGDAQLHWMLSTQLMLWFVTPPTMSVCNALWSIGNVTLAISLLYLGSLSFKVKSLQRLGIHKFYLWVLDLPMSCRYLTRCQGTGIIAPAIAAKQQAPLVCLTLLLFPVTLSWFTGLISPL